MIGARIERISPLISLSTTMESFPSFPHELLGAIVTHVRSPSDLLQLRATNSTLNTFATPLVFRSVTLANRDNRIRSFKLLANSRLAPHVREVVFQYMEVDPGTFILDRSIRLSKLILATGRTNTDRESEPVPDYAPRGYDGTAFVEALGHITHFPALESLVLNFRENDGPFKSDTGGDAHEREFPGEVILQFLIFKALSEQPIRFLPPLKSLIVDKYLPLPNPAIKTRSIIALLGKLSHLAIKTTSPCAAFPMTDPRFESYFSESLFQKEVVPTSLVSLELHHACVRPADMVIPISDLHFPHLQILSLQRNYFGDQSEFNDLEGFIARHGRTLLELKIFLCPMAMSTSMTPKARPKHFRRWSQLWERLNGDLKVLRNLVVSERHDSKGVEDDDVARYVDNCHHLNAMKLEESEDVKDSEALNRFQKIVESRVQ
jgi:hypothetical protein